MNRDDALIARRLARLARCRYFNRDDDDILSDAMYAAWKASRRFNGKGDVGGFIGVNVQQDIIDGKRARYGRPGSARYESSLAYVSHDYLVGLGRRDPQPVAHLIEALAGDDERLEFVVTKLYEGYTKTEIASMLGVSQGRVSQLLRKVRHNYSKLEAA